MLRPSDVFVPGKLPLEDTNVYANRKQAEAKLLKLLTRGQVPVVYGEYGVGKTSMARYCLRVQEKKGLLVNVESVAGLAFSDIRARLLEALDERVLVTEMRTKATKTGGTKKIRVDGGVQGARIRAEGSESNEQSVTESVTERAAVETLSDSKLLDRCDERGVVLLLDEMHKASAELRNHLTQFLKRLANKNCKGFKVVILGTASDVSELVESDPGIDRILEEIELEGFEEKEARFVVTKGMHDLDIRISKDNVSVICKVAVRSPHILQYLSLEVAERAFERSPRNAVRHDLELAVQELVRSRMKRLNAAYLKAIETTGGKRYRKQILRAMAEVTDDYVTMDQVVPCVTKHVGKPVPSTALSGPLKQLKKPRYGKLLRDVSRPDGTGRVFNFTAFTDPSMKAFLRMRFNLDNLNLSVGDEASADDEGEGTAADE